MTVTEKPAVQRLRITLQGAVQGVGFRPFVYRLATEMSLTGWVLNSSAGLVVEVEGPSEQLSRFEQRLEQERPKASVVTVREFAWLAAEGSTRFEILASDHDSGKTVNVLPDLATCPECREELFDPGNRRFEYPFTNCTNCGPRYTIVVDIPYDRPNTTMREFTLCPACREEYENPSNRRFHAQPNACPVCGPQLDGTIEDAVEALLPGRNRCPQRHWRIPASGRCPESRGSGPPAPAQASRGETVRADDAVARSGAGILRNVAGRSATARIASRAHRAVAAEASGHRHRLECSALLAVSGRDAAVLAAASSADAGVPLPADRDQRQSQRRAHRDRERRSQGPPQGHRRPFPDAQPPHRARLRRFGGAPHPRTRRNPAPRPRLRPAGHSRPHEPAARAGGRRPSQEYGCDRRGP